MLKNIQVLTKRFQVFMGMLDYFRHPSYKSSWDGPFNGQQIRCDIFIEIIQQLTFDILVETGTFRGTTTSYLESNTHLPVHTVENQERFYGYSKMRFLLNSRIHCVLDDSVGFLNRFKSMLPYQDKSVFFYLDAHWDDHVPLREEVDIIFDHWQKAVIMIDDFEVPDDKGYAFDDYGNGQVLSLGYLGIDTESDVYIFFPKAPSSEESGSKRGSVILTKNKVFANKLKMMKGLRKWNIKQSAPAQKIR